MPENLTPIRSLLAEAIDHLVACRVPVLITGHSNALQYKISGEVVSEGEIIARALARGMAGHSELRENHADPDAANSPGMLDDP